MKNNQLDIIPNRLHFFDNLRVLVIFFVTFFHSSMGYTLVDSSWRKGFPLDVFMMLTLFFISGYFVTPSLKRKGVKGFIKCKFKRLVIPLIFGALFVLPILDYFKFFFENPNITFSSVSLFEYWVRCVHKISEFNFGLINIQKLFNIQEQFYLHHFWFLSLLLSFFTIFLVLYRLKKDWFKSNVTQSGNSFSKSSFVPLIFFGLVESVYYSLSILFVPTEATFLTLGNLIQFQPARLGTYFGYFLLGIYGHSRNWFRNQLTQISVSKSVLITLSLSLGTVMVRTRILGLSSPSFGLYLVFSLFYNFLCLSFLFSLISITTKYWNRPTFNNHRLIRNSYKIYLLHYIPAVVIPVLISGWIGVPSIIKSIIVFIGSILISYSISEYGVRFLSHLIIYVKANDLLFSIKSKIKIVI
jgi:hypothetical protein